MSDSGSRPQVERTRWLTRIWLLWSAGALAAMLCAVAFLLWGLNGPNMLIDMIVALCV